MTRFTLLIVVLFSLFAGATAFGDLYEGEIRFSPADLKIQAKHGFFEVELKDGSTMQTVGAPALPVINIDVALPADAIVKGVKVLDVTTESFEGSYDIMPVTQPIHCSSAPPENPYVKDVALYGTDRDFPGSYAETINSWDMVGQDFVNLAFYPVQYNPVSGKVTLATSIRFQVAYEPSETPVREAYNFSEKNRAYYSKMLKRMAFNPEAIGEMPAFHPSKAARALAPGDYEYVIISASTFEANFQPLATWRTQMGMPAKVVTTAWVYSQYSGTNEESIRSFIIDANSTWGTMFVLLGGDTAYVPRNTKNIDGDNIPNDTYYGDFDGDWKYEVWVGRACVNNTTQANTFVNKVLTYEKNPPSTYGNKVFFMAFDADNQTPDEECKIKIKNESIPSYAAFVKEYDSESGDHESDVKNYMNQGQNLVNHMDHGETSSLGVGSTNHWDWLSSTEAQNFTNGTRYCNFYTVACEVGKYSGTCWGEALVRDDQGGITFVGNSRYGWYSPGNTNTLSSKYDQLWWHVLYVDNAYRAGETLGLHLNDYYPFSSTYKYIFTELNLLGDPALHLWTKNPTNLTVSHSNSIYTGSQSFVVNVKTGITNIQDALVCVMKGTDVYAYGTTDASGNASLAINPATVGTMTVTVTAQNYKYYQGNVTVSVGNNPPTIWNISPKAGPTTGGTAVTVSGTNFTTSPAMSVTIDGTSCTNITVTSSTTITCNTPAGINGWQDVVVSNTYGSDTLFWGEGYRYFPILTVPFNCTSSPTASVNTPANVNFIVSGNAGTPYILFYSMGGGPLPTPFGDAGLSNPFYQLFMSAIGSSGYSITPLEMAAGYGPLTFYLHVLGMNGSGTPEFAIGGTNPNGTGSVEFNLNN